jgi:3-oxoacyl-[acyl-carrier-protein] synthase-3
MTKQLINNFFSEIGISDIGFYIPNNFLNNEDKVLKFDLEKNFLEEKIGTKKVSRKFPEQETSDLCVNAFEELNSRINLNRDIIDCIVVITQNPDDDGLPHTSAIVHRKLNLSNNCAAFDISLGCSGYVYGLSIMKSFMEENRMQNGLLFTCDPYSKIIDLEDKNTSLLFGDAATVTLMNTNPKICLDKFIFATNGGFGNSLISLNGILSMNGRAVFNFCGTEVPKQIKELINSVNSNLVVDIYLLHQGSKFIIDTISRKLGINAEMAPCNLNGKGNTVSSSIPLLLKEYLDKSNVKVIIISGFGVGLSWATGILKRKLKP